MKNHQDMELMKLIAAAAAWPPNRNFLYYFLYLWSRCNTTLTEIHFKNQNDASVLNSLITSIPQEDALFLSTICDCNYADQRVDIPVGWKNNPFRFFFGDLERPLAFMERFIADFVPLDNIFREKLGFTPSSLLDFSLAHQDFLINKLTAITTTVDTNPGDSIVAPPHDFTEVWWQYIHDSWRRAFAGLSPDYRTEVQVWLEKKPTSYETARQNPQDYDSLMKLFPIIPSNDSFLVPFPHMWLNYLINIFVEAVRHLRPTEPRIESMLSDQAKIRMYRALAELTFQTPDAFLVTGVYLRNGKTSSEEIDALLIVDNDKLVVLESVAGIDSQNFEPLISKACYVLSSAYDLINKTSSSQEIEIVKASGQQIWPLKGVDSFRVYPVIVVNQLTLDAVSANLEGSPNDTQALMLTDMEALSSEIQDTLEFVRFLQAIVEIQNSGVKLIQTDFLDLWAWYRDNGHNFLWSAKGHPNAVFIDPHWYSGKEMESLAGKAKVRRLIITQRIPERCQFLNIDDSTVKLMDPISLIGVTIRTSKLVPQIIMVHICSRESESKDVQINESLAESLLRRYEEIRDVASSLISLAPVEVQERIVIWLYGERTLNSSQVLTHLRKYLDSNKQEPVLSKGTLLRDGAVGIAILYRDSLLGLMGAGTIEGEICLIDALLVGIGMAVNAPPELVKSIIQRTRLSPKKGINVDSIPTGHSWLEPHKPHDRSLAVTAQVTVEVSQMVASSGIKPGAYEGQDARDLINHKVFPFLRDSLDRTLQGMRAIDMVSWLYNKVENASAHYQMERLRLGSAASALDIEFDLGETASKVQKQDTQIIQAGGLVIERSSIVSPAGGQRMSREIGERLLGYAISLLELSQSSEQDYFGLQKMRIQITDDYEFKLTMTDEIVDLMTWQLDAAAEDVGREHDSGHREKREDANSRFTGIYPELKEIDTEFRNQFEYGLDDLLEVMAALSHYEVRSADAYFPLATAKKDELLLYLTTAIRDFQLEQGRKPLASLVLDSNLLKEDWRPWLLRGRKHRFATHPLFPLGNDQYLFGPWLLEHSCKTWLAYLFEGRLPLSEGQLSGGIRSALQAFRDRKNRKLEDDVAAMITKLNLRKMGPRIQRPEELWGCTNGLPVGEMDLIVADIDTRSLWVVEIKDPGRTLAVDDIAKQLKDYYEDMKGFQARLEGKHAYVTNCLPKVLSGLGISDIENWHVKAAFITRYPIAAAYAKQRKYPFFTLANIDKLKPSK